MQLNTYAASENRVTLFPLLAGFLLAMATLKITFIPTAFWVGQVSLALVFGFAVLGFAVNILEQMTVPSWRRTGIFIGWALMFIIYSIALIHGDIVGRGSYTFLQLSLVFCVFRFASSLRWNLASIRTFAVVFSATLIVIWLYLKVVSPDTGRLLPANANQIGFLALLEVSVCVLGLIVHKGRRNRQVFFLILLISAILLLLFSQSRTNMMAIGLFVGTYLLYPLLLRRMLFFSLWFVGIFLFIGICFHINTAKWREESSVEKNLTAINESLAEGKKMSSRVVVWTPIVLVLEEHPWTGMGLGSPLSEQTGVGLSAHSMYLQIGFQTGYPGMIAFVLLLYFIGVAFIKPASDYRFGRLGCTMLVVFAFHDGFETSLLENNLPIGVSAWFLLGLCLSLHNNFLKKN